MRLPRAVVRSLFWLRSRAIPRQIGEPSGVYPSVIVNAIVQFAVVNRYLAGPILRLVLIYDLPFSLSHDPTSIPLAPIAAPLGSYQQIQPSNPIRLLAAFPHMLGCSPIIACVLFKPAQNAPPENNFVIFKTGPLLL
jgi:hypothetical protein